MKLWKTLIIAVSVVILPFALVGVGQAQQMTCWGLRPNLTERTEHTDYSEERSPQQLEDIPEQTSDAGHDAENKNDTENVGSR
ncbi:MAG TPA: hypothetical protein VMT42_01185 [candidate division Zixibacteria bacterium]|nr:hypothetical protein [candidate division Zixibacteria bacterium]